MVKAWLVVVLLSIAATAQGAVISYASLASFTAAAGPQTVITFDGLPSGPVSTCTPVQPYTPDPCVFSQGAVTFVSTKGETIGSVGLQRPLLSIEGGGILSSAGAFVPDDFYATVTTHAIAFDVLGQQQILTRAILTEVGGATSTVDFRPDLGVPLFFGATSDVGFTHVTWVNTMSNFVIDNVSVDAAAVPPTPVPEPASLLLLGTGLAGIWRRRQ